MEIYKMAKDVPVVNAEVVDDKPKVIHPEEVVKVIEKVIEKTAKSSQTPVKNIRTVKIVGRTPKEKLENFDSIIQYTPEYENCIRDIINLRKSIEKREAFNKKMSKLGVPVAYDLTHIKAELYDNIPKMMLLSSGYGQADVPTIRQRHKEAREKWLAEYWKRKREETDGSIEANKALRQIAPEMELAKIHATETNFLNTNPTPTPTDNNFKKPDSVSPVHGKIPEEILSSNLSQEYVLHGCKIEEIPLEGCMGTEQDYQDWEKRMEQVNDILEENAKLRATITRREKFNKFLKWIRLSLDVTKIQNRLNENMKRVVLTVSGWDDNTINSLDDAIREKSIEGIYSSMPHIDAQELKTNMGV